MRLGTGLLYESRTLQGAHPKLADFCSAPLADFYTAVDKKGLWSPDAGALFYPMDIPVTTGVPVPRFPGPETAPPITVELHLRGGVFLNFYSRVDPVALTSLIRAVEAA